MKIFSDAVKSGYFEYADVHEDIKSGLVEFGYDPHEFDFSRRDTTAERPGNFRITGEMTIKRGEISQTYQTGNGPFPRDFLRKVETGFFGFPLPQTSPA